MDKVHVLPVKGAARRWVQDSSHGPYSTGSLCLPMNAREVVKLVSTAVLLIATSGCGTPGVPMPPSLDLPKPVEDLQASRRGDVVTLSWTEPQETTDETAIRKLGVSKICRVINQERIDGCVAVSELPPPQAGKRGHLPPQEAKQVLRAKDVLTQQVRDPHAFAVYAVEVQNARGRSAGLSNQVTVSLAPISQPEGLFEPKVTPDAVVLEGSVRLSPSASGAERFRLSRREKGTDQQIAVAEIPRPKSGRTGETIALEFRDETFEWEKQYEYSLSVVTTESLSGGRKTEFESDPTTPVSIIPHDVFPPARPTGVQAVYSGTLQGTSEFIDLTWNANSERDLAGYNVYRREEQESASAAMKINSKLLVTPSFRDQSTQKGRRYFYSVSGVDVRNNESERSLETSELVPK